MLVSFRWPQWTGAAGLQRDLIGATTVGTFATLDAVIETKQFKEVISSVLKEQSVVGLPL